MELKSVKTARQWSAANKLTSAINAGMFAENYKTHIGYLRFRDHVNSASVNNYQSVLAFNPKKGKEIPPFRIFDLDAPGISIKSIQEAAIQNLRLIKKPGINVWNQQD